MHTQLKTGNTSNERSKSFVHNVTAISFISKTIVAYILNLVIITRTQISLMLSSELSIANTLSRLKARTHSVHRARVYHLQACRAFANRMRDCTSNLASNSNINFAPRYNKSIRSCSNRTIEPKVHLSIGRKWALTEGWRADKVRLDPQKSYHRMYQASSGRINYTYRNNTRTTFRNSRQEPGNAPAELEQVCSRDTCVSMYLRTVCADTSGSRINEVVAM